MIARPLSPPQMPLDTPGWRRRFGFTLIELLVVLLIVAVLAALLFPSVRTGRGPARRSQCKNNLKQIGLALHNYAEQYGAFPPAYTVDAQGKPLHSWRTLILPYIEQRALYDQIDLAKPWNDPVNAEAFQKPIPCYSCPSVESQDGKTTYLAMAGPHGALASDHARPFSEITDGTSNTLLVIEVPEEYAVPWMAPHDADITLLLSLTQKTQRQHTGGTHGLLADGSVRFLSENLAPETWQGLCTVAGNDNVGEF